MANEQRIQHNADVLCIFTVARISSNNIYISRVKTKYKFFARRHKQTSSSYSLLSDREITSSNPGKSIHDDSRLASTAKH
ncbi:hypothetical protein J6590_000992 [Homalodisca vitripennis]|nr:hypothetical protein J6590_000992 [Homalodisca vitripennis]